MLTLLVTASGTIATYLYDEGASFATRVCTGACIGIAALGLVGFVFASFLGLTPASIVITASVLTLPVLILKDKARRKLVRGDWKAASQALKRTFSCRAVARKQAYAPFLDRPPRSSGGFL